MWSETCGYECAGGSRRIGIGHPDAGRLFHGLSVGAGVVIAQYFGAGQKEKMSQAVHSALALTVLLSALFTVAGIALTRPLLRLLVYRRRCCRILPSI